jgi:hypothetical protein
MPVQPQAQRSDVLRDFYTRRVAEYRSAGYSLAALEAMPQYLQLENEQQAEQLIEATALAELAEKQRQALVAQAAQPPRHAPPQYGPRDFPTAPNAQAVPMAAPPDAVEELQQLTNPDSLRQIAAQGPEAIAAARARMHALLGRPITGQDIRSLTSPEAVKDGTFAQHRAALHQKIRQGNAVPTSGAPFANAPRYSAQPRSGQTYVPHGLPGGLPPDAAEKILARKKYGR